MCKFYKRLSCSQSIAESGFCASFVSINEIAVFWIWPLPCLMYVVLAAVRVTANSQTSAQSPAGYGVSDELNVCRSGLL